MITLEILWRGAVLFVLALLAWNYFAGGLLLVGALLALCMPVWLYIALYSLNFI